MIINFRLLLYLTVKNKYPEYENIDDIPEKEIQSRAFKNIIKNIHFNSQVIRLFKKTREYLDSDFWQKDPIYLSDHNFQSRLWEMIMINYFLDRKADVVKTKDKKNVKNGNPDIQIRLTDEICLWVECVIATKGENPNDNFYDTFTKIDLTMKGYNIKSYGLNVEDYNRSKIIRLSQSVDDKIKTIKKWADKKIILEKDLCIISVNSTFWDTFELENLERILHGKAEEVLTYNTLKQEFINSRFQTRYNINKVKVDNSQTTIPTQLFLETSVKPENLVGVLYSGYPGVNSINRKSFNIGFDNLSSYYKNLIESLF